MKLAEQALTSIGFFLLAFGVCIMNSENWTFIMLFILTGLFLCIYGYLLKRIRKLKKNRIIYYNGPVEWMRSKKCRKCLERDRVFKMVEL